MRTLPRALCALSIVLSIPAAACDRPAPAPSPTPAPPAPAKPEAAPEGKAAVADAKADAKPDAKADANSGAKPDAKADPAAAEAKPADAAGEAKPPTDVALFAVRDKGLVALGDAGFSTVKDTEGRWIEAMSRGGDGKVRVLSSGEVSQIVARGDALELMPDFSHAERISKFDVDSHGVPWILGTAGVSHRDGETWTTDPKAGFGKGDVLLMGVAVDKADTAWVATADSIYVRKPEGWAVALPKGQRFISELARGPDGAVYASEMGALYRSTDKGTVEKVKVQRSAYGSLGKLGFSDTTLGVIQNDLEGIAVFLPADAAHKYKSPGDFKLGMLSAIAADDQRRVWVVGEGGVAILGPGAARVSWRSGSMEPIAGQISLVAVLGAGPKLPEAGEVKRGSLTGRIVSGDKGAAGLAIELCESPSSYYSKTPCTGAPTHLKGTTDADGRFSFQDVPLGAYGVGVKVGKKWQVTLGSAMGSKMKPGESVDIGEIELAAK